MELDISLSAVLYEGIGRNTCILQYFNKTIPIFSAVKCPSYGYRKPRSGSGSRKMDPNSCLKVFRLTRSFLLQGMAEAVKSPQAMYSLFNMRQEELKLR
jgi:hypothetical protein